MKHSLKIVILAVAIVSVCSWNSTKVTKQSDSLALQNIEALAENKRPLYLMDCIADGSVDCPIGYLKVKYVITEYSLGN